MIVVTTFGRAVVSGLSSPRPTFITIICRFGDKRPAIRPRMEALAKTVRPVDQHHTCRKYNPGKCPVPEGVFT
jgi:hypothetical protein